MNIHNKYQDPQTIRRIMSETRSIAVVGLSSDYTKAGYYVPEYLKENGYCIIPVNPNLAAALGEVAYPDLLSIPEPVDLVLVFRRSEAVPPFVDQAIQIGARALWMQLGISHPEAADKAQDAGLDVVMNACMKVEHRRWQVGA